ncbi:MAG: zinc-binding dehydrogenase, partial [Chloroflexi bacterium]|nr:zinc-binding dehydrogenase [Chloroflexota bacterium]
MFLRVATASYLRGEAMRGIRFLGDKRSEVIDYPDEEPDPGYVLLKMRSSGMCGSDLHRYRVPLPKEEVERDPVRPGHEPCGEVAVLGEGVEGLQIGDRILQHHYEGCGNCRMCREGWSQLCTGMERLTHGYGRHGGHGDYMIARADTCLTLPDELSYEVGAFLACGASTAFHGLKKLQLSGLDTIAIFGAGPVGLAGVMFAAEMGARVISVDISGERLEMAKSAGASEVVDNSDGTAVEQILDLTYSEGADASLEAIGIHQTRLDAVQSTKIFGRCCFVGEGGDFHVEPSPDIIHRHLTLVGSWTFSTFGLEEAARYTARRNVPLESLITGRCVIE